MASLSQFIGLSRGLPGGSVGDLFEHTVPGFGLLQSSIARWANMDIATIAAAVAVFGAVATGTRQLRRIVSSIQLWATRLCTASVSIPGHDRLNREVLNWMGAHVLVQRGTRVLTASSRPVLNEAMRYRDMATVRLADPKEQKLIPVQYLPTFGTTWFFHERHVFIVRRTNFDGGWPNEYAVAPQGDEPLVVMCLGRSVSPIKNFLKTCREFAASQRETFVTVRSPGSHRFPEDWDTTILKPVRPLETVHMDPATKDELVADIENYLQPLTRRFYGSRGIPYRRGYLLHGPPGTGKTSLSLALAGKFGLELYILRLPSVPSDAALEQLFASLPPQCIVLLEDIDAVGLKRQARRAEDDYSDDSDSDTRPRVVIHSACTLSGLLNVLDGVTSQEGRIVLMTSNVAEDLDEALTRPGRIDKKVFMGDIGQDASREMFLRMYRPDPNEHSDSITPSVEDVKNPLTELAKTFADSIPDGTFSPAQLQGYLLSHRNQPAQAVADCSAWVEGEKARMKEVKEREAEQARKRANRRAERRAKMQRRFLPRERAPYIIESDSDVSANGTVEPRMAHHPSGGHATAKSRRPRQNKMDPEPPLARLSADHKAAETSIFTNGVDSEDSKCVNGDELTQTRDSG